MRTTKAKLRHKIDNTVRLGVKTGCAQGFHTGVRFNRTQTGRALAQRMANQIYKFKI
jgi:hypothetical protein